MIYLFGACAFDTCLYSLQRGGQTTRLRPKVFRVCLYLLEHRDRVVTREELCAQVWPGQFISQATLEGVIRAVRQAVGDSGQAQGIIQTLHGYGYRFVAPVEERPPASASAPLPAAVLERSSELARGQPEGPTAAVVAWPALEATPGPGEPDERRHESTAPRGPEVDDRVHALGAQAPTRPQATRGLRLAHVLQALIILILLLLGSAALWWEQHEAARGPLDRSRLAVLPFVHLGAATEHPYFADGMTEELITQLSQIRGLTVIARTSVMKYKGTTKDVATIGRELQVGTLLEGSVRHGEHQVRISAQLIDVASQSHLWAQEYDRELKDVFEIQRDIATRVAHRLKVQVSAGEQRQIEEQGTGNLAAYTWYLQGRYFRNQWTEAGLRQAIAAFERAVERDPHYALAYAGMADAYLLLPFVAATTRPLDIYPRARAAVEQAVRHGEAFATVHTTVASAKLWYAWDWGGAEAAFRQALTLSPNDAAAHRRYAWYLITMGRVPDAIAVMHRAQELNPLSPGIAKNVGLVFYYARQYDQAIAHFRAALELDPTFRPAFSGLVYAYLQQGRPAEAYALCQQMHERWGEDTWVLWDLGYTAAVSGHAEQARQALATLRERAQQGYVKPLALAWIALGLDEREQAFAWLEQAYAERDPYLTLLTAEPVYDPVRHDPRFTALVHKLGLTP